MSAGAWPNTNLLIDSLWGGGGEFASNPGLVIGLVCGTNPPYTLSDLLAIYPKFFGAATALAGVGTVTGSNQITATSTAGLAPGQFLTAPGIPDGTVIQSVSTGTATLSQNATATASGITLQVYESPFVPALVIQMYINLASACLVQARWQDQWTLVMALFVAHYATLWVRSEGDQYSTPGQVASSGLERGMLVSKGVDGVSAGYQNMMANYASWGAWPETTYGAQLITMAKIIGASPMLVW